MLANSTGRRFQVVVIIPLETLEDTVQPGALAGLKAYLGNVVSGFDEQLSTPFAQGSPQEQAHMFYEEIARSSIPELNELEVDEMERFGPYSVRLPWDERKEGVLEYFQPRRSHHQNTGLSNLARLIPAHSISPLSFKASFDAMPKDSNLGLPVFSSDKKFLDEYLTRANDLKAGGYRDNLFPAILGWRGQANGDPNYPKQRVVWMEDHLETIVGLSIQIPLLERLRSHPSFAAWNDLNRVDKVITSIIDRSTSEIMSADFSGFDKYCTLENISDAFDLIRYWFVKGAASQIDWLEEQFLDVGLVTPDGIFTGKIGAVPSGSALTNLVDSLVQLIMVNDLVDFATVLGDDGVYTGADDQEVSTVLWDRYGAVISPDKGGYSKDQVMYLQRLHLRSFRRGGICVGIRSILRSMNSICHLERHTPDLHPAFFSARAISIIENSANHPRFRLAVKWLYQNDELMRKYDPSVLFKLAGGARFVEKKLGLDSFKFGRELPSLGLDSFKTVKLLREFRSGINSSVA